MRREGSPWRGLGVVFLKELSDHLTSARMLVLELLVVLIPVAALYGALQAIRENAQDIGTISQIQEPFLFLRVLTVAREPLLSFVSFLGFLVPLMAIGLAFDAINGEHNRRTLSRILAQPIYRDALLFGKFLAGLSTLAISLIALWLLVIGFALFLLGVPPSAEEMARSFVFLLVTIAYASVWLSLSMLFSIIFRSAATAALVTLGLWLFLAVLWPALAPGFAEVIAPQDPRYAALGLPTPDTIEWQQILARFSPSTLYSEIIEAVLNPSLRGFGLMGRMFLPQGAVPGAPLSFGESVMMAWPQIVGLIAGTIVLFVIGYIVFQRQEVRA